jgi:hypothetical protein
LRREDRKLEEENYNTQLKDENFVIRRKNKSSLAIDAKVSEEDFLTKYHSDILGEALKSRFEMKLNKKATNKNLVLNQSSSTQSIFNMNKQGYLEDQDEDINPIFINQLYENRNMEYRYLCRLFDKNSVLFIVNERYLYLIFHEIDNEDTKQGIKVNSQFEILVDEKQIKGKFKGIVLLRNNNNNSKSKYKELEISFSEESYFK